MKYKILFFIFLSILTYFIIRHIDFKLFLDKFNADFFIALCFSQTFILFGLIFFVIRHIFFIGIKINFLIVLNAMILSVGLNFILPGRISELIKATYIRDKTGLGFSIGMGAVFLERFADLIILVFISFAGIAFFTINIQNNSLYIVLTIIIVICLGIYLEKYILLIINKVVRYERLKNFLNSAYLHIKGQLFTKKFSIGLLYSFVIWVCSALSIFTFLNIAGTIELGIIQVMIILLGGSLGLAIPALPGGLGTFEAIVVTILMKYGYDFNTALALAIGLRINNMIIILPYALIIAFKNGTGLKKMYQDLRQRA